MHGIVSTKETCAKGENSVSDLSLTATNTGASSMPLIDDERVEEMIDLICGGAHAALSRWIDYLEADVAKFEALLPVAGTAEGIREIQGMAHSIKGTCLNIGAQALGALFSKIEQAAKEGAVAALNEYSTATRALAGQSVRALREISKRPDVDS
jgi:HPt (histidine-containing phosphotransfer) domain-containing protein